MKLDSLRILLVEDHVHMAEILRAILRGFDGRMVSLADTLEAGWAALQTEPFDLLIVDRNLGPQDGLDLIRRVRQSPGRLAFLPILMVTGSAEKWVVAAARDAGVNEFLAKPVSVTDLYRKLAAIIDHPRPFVRTPSYVGPDRRRRADPNYAGADRRVAAGAETEAGPSSSESD